MEVVKETKKVTKGDLFKGLLVDVMLWMRILIEYKDADGSEQHRFNLANPLGWVLLLIVALLSGMYEFFHVFITIPYTVITDTLHQKKNAQK